MRDTSIEQDELARALSAAHMRHLEGIGYCPNCYERELGMDGDA